jgi:hypothetical protein
MAKRMVESHFVCAVTKGCLKEYSAIELIKETLKPMDGIVWGNHKKAEGIIFKKEEK